MIRIVPLQASHKEPIRKLLAETNAFRDDEIEVALELIDECLSYPSFNPENYQIYSALEGERVLGYVCFGKTPMTLSTYDLYWIAVAPDAQGKGVGKKLFGFACDEIQKQGGKLVVIETSSQPQYDKTRRFYEAIGCQLEARIRDFYRVGDDKLIYAKRL
ncbi:MAG: GNAT family N-acetyltransferase [Chloroherpetonaceae bacterium]|nr:GNAT family N-acetyltransferase [Chloroherpetonaceae bacterium]MDW8436533.1 GNAT family N-acetyltransferase [Chloroherpetonaceae bacterium]